MTDTDPTAAARRNANLALAEYQALIEEAADARDMAERIRLLVHQRLLPMSPSERHALVEWLLAGFCLQCFEEHEGYEPHGCQ